MPPDYSGQNLRGRSFKGQNLEGVNFSGADIRGADFSGANLKGTKFVGVKAGLQWYWTINLLLISLLISTLLGFVLAFTTVTVETAFTEKDPRFLLAGVLIQIILGIFFIVTIRQDRSIIYGAIAGIVVGAIAAGVAMALEMYVTNIGGAVIDPIAVAVAVVVVGTMSIVAIVTGAFAAAVTRTLAGTYAMAFAGVFAVAGAFAGTIVAFIAFLYKTGLTVIVVVGTGSIISVYFCGRALSGDEKYTFIRTIAIAFAAIGGTSFQGADLTEANFTSATLKSTDFRKAILTRTCFYKTKKLDRVRPGITYLQNTQLRQLLVSGLGQNKNFDRQDLRGVNLQGANLADASFIDTDFSQANLHSANLFEAKLVRTNLDQANLSHAYLTGAYIEDWGITRKTKLDSVECKYVYLKLPTEGDRDPNRMPPSEQGDFEENDFNIFITSVLDTLDLYHKQDINAAIAITVLKGLTRDYPVQFELVGLEKRGNDQFLIRLKVFGYTSHFQLQREYYARYEQTLPLYDPKKLMPDTDILVEEIIKTVKENPGTRIENLHNEGIVITGGNVNMTAEQNRNINTGGGNYNENIQGDYIEGDYSPER